MSASLQSPPAGARVALELLETLRTLGTDGRALVAARTAVDRLRLLIVQRLASGGDAGDAEDAGDGAALLAADAAEQMRALASGGDGDEDEAVAALAVALDLHRRVDALEAALGMGDASASASAGGEAAWMDQWQRDGRELLARRMRGMGRGDGLRGDGPLRTGADDQLQVRDAIVAVVDQATGELGASARRGAVRARLVAAARSSALPTLRRRVPRAVVVVERPQGRRGRAGAGLGVIPPRELSEERPDGRRGRVGRGEWLGASVSLVPTAAVATGESREAFRTRVGELFRLHHPNVLQVLGGCERADGSRVFVCEPVADGSLLDLMAAKAARHRRVPSVPTHADAVADADADEDADEDADGGTPRFVWRVLLQAALGLKFLHQRGLAWGELTCGQVLVGADGAARVPAFAELSPGDPSRWRAPERTAEGAAPSAAADAFSFGMCVVEAAAVWQRLARGPEEPETEVDGPLPAPYSPACERTGEGPARPRRGFSDEQWALVAATCRADPRERMEMASVVHEIERWLLRGRDGRRAGDGAGLGLSLAACPLAGPPAGVAETLDELQALVEAPNARDEDARRMAEHVLHRLLDVHARLERWAAASERGARPRRRSLLAVCGMAGDARGGSALERAEAAADGELRAAVASFRETLARFFRLVEAADRAASAAGDDADADAMLALLCASRTVGADEHYGVHVAIDELLRRHLRTAGGPADGDVHDWKPRWDEQRARQVGRAKRRLQTLLRRSEKGDCGRGALSAPPAASTGAEAAPEWFTPPHEVLFDPRRPFSEGAFGSAHLGSWLDAPVVVKRIKTSAAAASALGGGGGDQGGDAVFEREVGIWHALRHPHVLALFGASSARGERFFVCEHATRGELSDFLAAVGGREGEAARVAAAWAKLLEAARGLRYLHSRGVLHQDLKCDNILVGSDGLAKLADFGLSAKLSDLGPAAKLRDAVLRARLADFARDPRLRRVVASARRQQPQPHPHPPARGPRGVGAPRWKAPEVLAGRPPSAESDVFSLGMCVLEAVSGQLPWGPALPDAAVAFHVKRGALPPLDAARFSAGERALVMAMCRKDPTQRLPLERVLVALEAVAGRHQAALRWGATT